MPLWGGCSEKYLKKGQVILNAAARWASGLGRRTRTKDLMVAVGWLSIKEQVKVSTLVFTWKVVHEGKPRKLLERLTVTPDKKLEFAQPRLQFTRDSRLRWRSAQLWNNLPEEIRTTTRVAVFKRQVKKMVLEERTWDPGDQIPG